MLTFNKLGRYGRIANQMFQIAGTIGLATKHGYEFGFPEWMNWDEKERFSGTDDINIQEWFKNPLPKFEETLPEFNVPWGYRDYTTLPDNVSLVGHMQSEKYFLHCKDLIKHYFEFKEQTAKRTNTVAVHFRGGDYGGNYHPTCSREYYQKAASCFDSGFKFLLFTDDPERAKDVIPFDYELIDTGHAMTDLEMMTRCDAHIIANSTFSWWGAWLSDSRRVIAPARWFGSEAKINGNDLYCENWIVL